VESVAARAKELGYAAAALTDINNLYGAVRFYSYARELGIKPIIGCDARHGGSRALLLARNLAGYSNLCRIITRLKLSENFSLAAAIARFREGLHVLTEDGALASGLARRIDRGRLWLMLARPGRAITAQRKIVRLSRELGLGLAATPDVYFLDRAEEPLHRVLSAIRENTLVQRPGAALAPPGSVLPPAGELERLFGEHPESLRNNARIVKDCNLEIPTGKPIFPRFTPPGGETARAFLSKLCFAGLKQCYRPVPRQAVQRLEHELGVIEKLGFTGYFLFVHDILAHAREKGIATIGRGSGASSIVSFLLGITNVDPLRYDIPFERFLHLKRADCPDLDIDLCWIRRDEVIDGIYRKYGASRVAMVSTHNTFRIRGAVRETARAFGVATSALNRLSRHLPHDSGQSVLDVLNGVPASVRDCIDGRTLHNVARFAEEMRGFPRHLGIHCGGLVIGDRALDTYVPLERAAKGTIVTQFEKDAVEEIGLVKMDFLGNHGLTIRDETIRLIRERGEKERPPAGRPPTSATIRLPKSPAEIPLDDARTAELVRSGKTIGCCQLESPAMRNLLQMLRASSTREVMQALALVRPGPSGLGMKERFVRRARKFDPVSFAHPSLADVLSDSHGVMLYEDDTMLVARALTGASLEEGDLLRKAVSKKRFGEGASGLPELFVQKALVRGVSRKTAEEMWAQIARFSSYSFCKAHAASYGILAWQLAYLKARHPIEFMTAALNHQLGLYPKRVLFEEVKRLGIEVALPCANRSERAFAIDSNRIRIGLEQVKGLAGSIIDDMIAARRAGLFLSLCDFIARTGTGPKDMEKLILCGAFDFTDRPRPGLIWEAKAAFRSGRKKQCRGASPGTLPGTLLLEPREMRVPDLEDYSLERKLLYEFDILELSVRRHPIELIRPGLRKQGFIDSSGIRRMAGRSVRAAGILAARRVTDTRRGGTMEFLTLEDEKGLFEAALFPPAYRRYRHLIEGAGPYFVSGTVEDQYGAISVNVRKVSRFQDGRWDRARDRSASGAAGRRPSSRAACRGSAGH